ncbi:hypothetical protein [Aquirufa antheringensis]|uniref:hypothetical protein n=1 Tax=Aquirufa antheringensis TaxID=2516559 RepID=UPI0022A82FE3|nr:hypothetical protein [Aquirufa antheringensis]MCZ2487190.1 hypothetical protein [Aquirufa antheringensis]MCZ2489826.1 hypothetical protein [Aquirufa antheringensis]
MKKIVFFLSISFGAWAQTGIGTTAPAASAKLEVYATNKGFLPPRIALTGAADASTIASPVAGLLIYNTATAGIAPNNVVPGYYYWNGTAWIQLTGGLVIDASKTTSFSVTAVDNNKLFLISSSTAVTVTIPNTLPIGFSCQFIQTGSGTITLAGSGFTLNSANGLTSRSINSAIGLVMSTSTSGYVFGDTMN